FDETPVENLRLDNLVVEVNSTNSNKQKCRERIIKEVCIGNMDDEGLNRSEKTKVKYIPMMFDVINPDRSGVGGEEAESSAFVR
ncbi:30769_t:CDS:1, partial [Gigaspora margarita]